MHEQSFEKQVQQKMDELTLAPSAPVWQKVESQIRKKKERRRVLFWMLPLLLVGGGAYWLLSGTSNPTAPVSNTEVRTQQPSTQPIDPSEQTAPGSMPEERDNNTEASSPTLPSSAPIQSDKAIIATPRINNPTVFLSKAGKQNRTLPIRKQLAQTSKEAVTTTEDVAIQKSATTPTQPVMDTTAASLSEAVTEKEETGAPKEVTTEVTPPSLDSASVVPTPPAKAPLNRKWALAVHAEAGITSIQSSLISLPSTRDAFASPATNTGGFAAVSPSLVENGPAFSAGITARRNLNGRTKLTIGAQYSFYSNRSEVGQKVVADTALIRQNNSISLATHYRAGNQQEYHNNFHFLQVPIGIEYRLLKKVPLQVQAGVSVAQLIASNALLFDNRANIYYKNTDAFHKTQLHLFTNLTYTIWKVKSKEINLGPYAQYGLTELQKGAGEHSRLFSAGLRTQLSF